MRIALASSLLLLATPALAAPAPNLSVSGTPPPATTVVYTAGTFNLSVANLGNRDAAGVVLSIQLPKTGTSPQVHVMGTLGARSANCAPGGAAGTLAGTRLVCNLGTIRRGRSSSVTYQITLPQSAGPLTTVATATTTTPGEIDPGNNSWSHAFASDGPGALAKVATSVSTAPIGDTVPAYLHEHCTGTGLTSYFECALFPGSISAHVAAFHFASGNRTLSFPSEPGYGGSWEQPDGDTLAFTYTDPSGVEIAHFFGHGVGGGCFEGLTTFPGSSYVSPYRVCLQP